MEVHSDYQSVYQNSGAILADLRVVNPKVAGALAISADSHQTDRLLWIRKCSSNDLRLRYLFGNLEYELRCEKTGLRGFRPGLTQTKLYRFRRWLEA